MRFTSIKSSLSIEDESIIAKINDKGYLDTELTISASVEQSGTRYISFWINHESSSEDALDIYLDLDIYQAELFAKKLQSLVDERKMYLENKMKE